MEVTLYSSGCPKCEVLKSKLKGKNISFLQSGNFDGLIQKGFMQAPVLEVDGRMFDFAGAIRWLSSMDQIKNSSAYNINANISDNIGGSASDRIKGNHMQNSWENKGVVSNEH